MNASPNNPNAPDPLAVALSKLDPAPHGFDWNALMFAAGRASKTRALTFWKAAAGVCALVAAGFAVAFFTRPQVATERERVIYVERAPEKPADPPPPVAAVPVPEPAPGAKPAPESVAQPVAPEPVSPAAPSDWTFGAAAEQGAALRWFTMRDEVLSVGLSVLPDPGRKAPPPPADK